MKEIAEQAAALANERRCGCGRWQHPRRRETGVATAVAPEEGISPSVADFAEEAACDVVGFRQAMSQAQQAIAGRKRSLKASLRRKRRVATREEKLATERETTRSNL